MQPTSVTTGKVRFSYVDVWQAKAYNPGDEPKYSAAILIPKHDMATINAINAAINAAVQAGMQTLANQNGQLPPNLKMPLRDGDIERDSPEYAGHYFINASSKRQPGIVDAQVQPILNQNDFYSGCYGRANINFYAFNNKGNKGIAVGLNHVQKLEDGMPLAGGTTVEEAFGAPQYGAPQQQYQQPPAQQQYQQPPAQQQYQQPPAQQQYQQPPAQQQYQQPPAPQYPQAPPAPTQWGNAPQQDQQQAPQYYQAPPSNPLG